MASDWTFDLGESNILKLGQVEGEAGLCHQKSLPLVGNLPRKVTRTCTGTASVSSSGERESTFTLPTCDGCEQQMRKYTGNDTGSSRMC